MSFNSDNFYQLVGGISTINRVNLSHLLEAISVI